MEPKDPHAYLQHYIKERLPHLAPGVFEGAPDIPYFTVDQRYQPLKTPPYPV
jgi:hypothetical protein